MSALGGEAGMTGPERDEWRQSLATQTAPAREKAIAAGPKKISANGEATLRFLFERKQQQEPGAA